MIAATILLLAGWSLTFRDLNRGRILTSSLWLFALPTILLVTSNYAFDLVSFIPAIIFIILEETLKLIGSRAVARSQWETVGLITLSGIWEILITKLFMIGFQIPEFYVFLSDNYAAFILLTLTPFLMHSTTAILYALLRGRLWVLPFILCLLVHVVFNYTRDFYIVIVNGRPEISLSFMYFDGVFFAVIWLLLLRTYRRKRRVAKILPQVST